MLNNSANVLLSCNVIIKQQTDEIVVLNLIPVVLMLAPCYSTFVSMTLFIYYLLVYLFIYQKNLLIVDLLPLSSTVMINAVLLVRILKFSFIAFWYYFPFSFVTLFFYTPLPLKEQYLGPYQISTILFSFLL